jgi:hypothetical protein
VFIALQSCKYRKTPVFTGKKSFIALGSGGWQQLKKTPKQTQDKKSII